MLPAFLLNHFEYLPDYYHCQIVYSNLQGLILVAFPIYYFPYASHRLDLHLHHLLHPPENTFNRLEGIGDDQIVGISLFFRRIAIIVGLLWTLSFPFMILWLLYITTGYLYPLSYHLQWLTFAVSLLVLPITSRLV